MFRITLFAALALSLLTANVSLAADAPKKQPATNTGKPAKNAPLQPEKARSWSADQAAARNEIINSKEWGDAMRSFDEWQSVQQTYDKQQARALRVRLINKINNMDAEQLADFLPTFEQKLKILLSSEAREARSWFRQNLELASDSYAAKMRKQLPDVANMTPEQLEESLETFEGKLAQQQKVQTEFNAGRKQQVKNVESELARQRKEQDENIDRAYESSNAAPSGGGYYAPGQPYDPPNYNGGYWRTGYWGTGNWGW